MGWTSSWARSRWRSWTAWPTCPWWRTDSAAPAWLWRRRSQRCCQTWRSVATLAQITNNKRLKIWRTNIAAAFSQTCWIKMCEPWTRYGAEKIMFWPIFCLSVISIVCRDKVASWGYSIIFAGNCDDVIGKNGLLNGLKNFGKIKMKFYYINLSQLSTFTKYIFLILTLRMLA